MEEKSWLSVRISWGKKRKPESEAGGNITGTDRCNGSRLSSPWGPSRMQNLSRSASAHRVTLSPSSTARGGALPDPGISARKFSFFGEGGSLSPLWGEKVPAPFFV